MNNMAKNIRDDGDGFISQECERCHLMLWEERFFTHSDGSLKDICAMCEWDIHRPSVT